MGPARETIQPNANMPVHLPLLKRRAFLRRALFAAAGAACSRPLFAAPPAADPHQFALLADTHIPETPDLAARGVNMSAHLTTVGRELAALPTRPAAALINGDCAYLAGTPGDYANLVKLLAPLRAHGVPIHLTLGNHDHRENFRAGLAEAQAGQGTVTDKHVTILRAPRANWFLLDSLEAVNKTPGSLGEAQLQWLTRALDEHADKPAILFAHHNPHLREVENKTGLKDTEQLLEIARPRRHVKAYVFGHTHNWNLQTTGDGLHMINLPPVAYVFDKARPSGWVHATLTADGISLELRSLDPAHPEHGQVKELRWRKG
jgi:3',5'-cyclic-AMP phosphodiesterase